MDTKKTAPAEQSSAPEKDRVHKITGVKLHRQPMQKGVKSIPAALYASNTAPDAGDVLQFTLENGVTYRGVVREAVVAQGQVMVEFRSDLTVVPISPKG